MRLVRDKHFLFFLLNISVASFFVINLLTEPESRATNITPGVLSSVNISDPVYEDDLLQKTATGINTTREKQGLSKLPQSMELDIVAQARAKDMAKNGYYAHKSPDGKIFADLMKETGIKYTYSCENLNTQSRVSASTYINTWLESTAGHRECLLGESHTKAGYAVATIKNINGTPFEQKVIVAIYSN